MSSLKPRRISISSRWPSLVIESRRRAGHLDHRVVGGRRAVDDHVGAREQVGERDAGARRELADAAEHALGLVARRRRMLVERDRAVVTSTGR
jgi:hypothetical protein